MTKTTHNLDTEYDHGYPMQATDTSSYILEKIDNDTLSIKTMMRNESIVRNPCLPKRWKKGSKNG